MTRIQQIFIAFLFVVAAFLLWRHLQPVPPVRGFDVDTFGRLPVQEGGRLKPMDAVARASLMTIGGKQTYRDLEGRRHSASEWLMELTMDPGTSAHRRVFRVDHPQVASILGENNEERKFFSFAEIAGAYDTLVEQFALINEVPVRRDTYQRALVKLQTAIAVYDGLAYMLTTSPTFGGMEREQQIIRMARTDLTSHPMGSETYTLASNALELMSSQYQRISVTAMMQAIPPRRGELGWRNLGEAMLHGVQTGEFHPIILSYGKLAEAWRNKEVLRFNTQLQELFDELHVYAGDRSHRIQFEHFFHNFAPFYFSMEIYFMVFFTALFSWMFWTRTLTFATFWLMVIAFLLHTFGLVARVYIQERPPVTNLYSSAVFVGWAAVLICLFLERLYKNCVSAAAAAMIGFCTLIIAHHLSFTGDTLEVMRAVLDSNFWLATHVPTVTMGYSAAFLAGFLGILYIIRDRIWGGMTNEVAQSIERMVYGVVCFALLFSFVGTVLGGIWADQSWGRFWGWDPKENGALMIVLWMALILHARWGKIVSPTGIMQLAIVGNIITAWSWFGTNMLGVGLHSYGFMDKAFFWLALFVGSQLLFIALGWLPQRTRIVEA